MGALEGGAPLLGALEGGDPFCIPPVFSQEQTPHGEVEGTLITDLWVREEQYCDQSFLGGA